MWGLWAHSQNLKWKESTDLFVWLSSTVLRLQITEMVIVVPMSKMCSETGELPVIIQDLKYSVLKKLSMLTDAYIKMCCLFWVCFYSETEGCPWLMIKNVHFLWGVKDNYELCTDALLIHNLPMQHLIFMHSFINQKNLFYITS